MGVYKLCILSFLKVKNMIKIYCLLPLIILSLLEACTYNKSKKEGKIEEQKELAEDLHQASGKGLTEIKIDPYDEGYPFDELMDSVSFVKLETTDDNLIGVIDDVFFVNDLIIVVDKHISTSIGVYDKTGKFLYKISNKGEGVGEYKNITYVTLTPDQTQLAVVDLLDRRLKYFSIDNKVAQATQSFLVKSVYLPFFIPYLEFISDEVIAGCDFGGFQVPNTSDKQTFVVTDLYENIKYAGYKSFYSKNFITTTPKPLHKFDSEVFFNPSFSDTIYNVTLNGLIPRYVLNIKGKRDLRIDENTTSNEFRERLRAAPYFNSHFVELDNIAVFDYMGNQMNKLAWCLYLKQEDKTYHCNGKCKNRLFPFFRLPAFKYQDDIVAVPVNPNRFLAVKNALLASDDKAQVERLLDGLTEDDNPVIMFFHMKTKIQK